MKLYYAPGACSLADHIALHEAGLTFDHVQVDLSTHHTAAGEDFYAINPKGYVPALVLDSGETLTENIAILDWIAQQAPALVPGGALGRTHQLEALAFISTEIHKSFKPFFSGGGDDELAAASKTITQRFGSIASAMQGDYLFGSQVSVADAYLFVMTLWASKMGVAVPAELSAFIERMQGRAPVQTAMKHEGLIPAG